MIRRRIQGALEAAVREKYNTSEAAAGAVTPSDNPVRGDYAANTALIFAHAVKKNPLEIAEALRQKLQGNSDFEKIEIAPPGFINFWLSPAALQEELKLVLEKKSDYGRGFLSERKRVQVEFISANPTGPLTLANGRGGFLGDALSRVLEAAGYDVEREYYINDAGNQILILGKSLLAAHGMIPEEENFYKGSYIAAWADGNNDLMEKYKDEPMALGERAADDFLRTIQEVIEKKARIRFDRLTSERKDIRGKAWIPKAIEIFEKEKALYEKDGARWLATTRFGDDKDRVAVTSDGFPTYFLADAAHYLETKTRGFEIKINILGPDHYGYVARIQAAAKMIGLPVSHTIVTQAVRLMQGGKEMRMSKRKGVYVAFEELLDRVPLDVVRFFFLEKSPDTHIDFDLDLAKERSVKNPVYYVQYAHARMESIFQKAKNPGGSQNAKIPGGADISTGHDAKLNLLNAPEELFLIKKLIQFPEVVEDTARDYHAQRLPQYALELARAFHAFYEQHRVITDDTEVSAARLALVGASQIILKNTLALMGIGAPEKM